jgi:hypothetical protein
MYTMQPGLDVLRASYFPNPIVEDWADVQLSSEYVNSPPPLQHPQARLTHSQQNHRSSRRLDQRDRYNHPTA